MATKVALGHHHAIVVVAVEVSTVGGSTRVGQMRPMPDRELVARGRKVEGTAGRGVGHIGDGAGERRGDGGRAGGLGVRGDVRETAAREKGTTSAQGQPRQRDSKTVRSPHPSQLCSNRDGVTQVLWDTQKIENQAASWWHQQEHTGPTRVGGTDATPRV